MAKLEGFTYKENLNIVYDPELNLWAIIDEDGYIIERYISKEEAKKAIKDC